MSFVLSMKKLKYHLLIIVCVFSIFGCKKETSKNLKSITEAEQSILDSLDKYDFSEFMMSNKKASKDKRKAAVKYNNDLYFKMYETFQGENKIFCVKGAGTTLEKEVILTYFIVSPGKVIIIIDARSDIYGPKKCIIKRKSNLFKLAQWEMKNNSLQDSILIEIDKDNYNKEKSITPIFDYNKELLNKPVEVTVKPLGDFSKL
jgi:hypothetical protein